MQKVAVDLVRATVHQYGISFLGLNVHFDIFARRNGPSVSAEFQTNAF